MKTRTQKTLQHALIGMVLCLCSDTNAVDIFKADSADNLNLGSSWTGIVAPTSSDVGVWNATVQVNTTSALGADVSWAGIRITDPAALISISAGNILTLGASGVDMGAATQDLQLDHNVNVGASQAWSVGAGRTLTISTPIAGGAGVLTKNGDGTVNLSATVNGTFSGPTIVNGGVLVLNSANANNNSALGTGVITNNGATLRLGAARIIGNALHFNGNCTVDVNNFATPMDGAWSGSGTVTITNMASGTFTIGGNGNGGGNMANFSGTIAAGTSSGSLRFNNGGGVGGGPNFGTTNLTLDLGTGTLTFLARNGGVTINIGALTGGSATAITGPGNNNGLVTCSVGAKNIATTFAGVFRDNTSARNTALTKVGDNVFTLIGENTNTGPMTVNGGTLEIGNGGTTGTPGLGNLVVNNNSSLLFNRSDDLSITNGLGGTGGNVIKTNNNVLTYFGTNTSSSVTLLVKQGALAVGDGAVILGPISLAAGAAFDATPSTTFTLQHVLTGVGTVRGTLTAGSGGVISPAGNGIPGTLTFSNVVQTGGVINRFDLSDDPSGTTKTNDLIDLTGDLTLSGVNNILVNALDSSLALGTYTLIQYDGNLSGDIINNLSLTVVGGSGVLTNPPGAIALILTNVARASIDLTWTGDGAANNWDVNVSTNWRSGSTPFTFLNLDNVRFDNTGDTNPVVNLPGTVLPRSVTVDGTSNYTFTSGGKISGSGSLTKTNTGTLTIQTTNDFTGPATIGGGVVETAVLANGGSASAVGAAGIDPTNLVFHGSTLRYTGLTTASDRGVTLNGSGVTVDVATDTETLTGSGTWVGTGGLTKVGLGTLALSGANSFSGGVVVSNGTLRLNTITAAGTNAITLAGGTLLLAGPSDVNFPNSVNVVTTSGLAMGVSNNRLDGSISSNNTLNITISGGTLTLNGILTNFTGTFDLGGSSGFLRFNSSGNNTFGSPNATFDLGTGTVTLNNRNGSATTPFALGALAGSAGTTLSGAGSVDAPTTYRIGDKGLSTTFSGTIAELSALRSTHILKVGTGTLTLEGQGNYSGSTTISNGVLALNGDGTLFSTTNIFVNSGAVLDVSTRSDGTLTLNATQNLRGNGTVRGNLVANFDSVVSPGDSIGTLTVTNAVTLSGTTVIEINRAGTPKSDKLSARSITIGGTIVVTNIGGNLQVGDQFDLFDGALTDGSPTVIVPAGHTFNTSQLAVDGTITVTAVPTPPQIDSVVRDSGTNLVVNGSGGSAFGSYLVLSATNVNEPLVQWVTIATNQFDENGNFSFTNAIVPAPPQLFLLIQQP